MLTGALQKQVDYGKLAGAKAQLDGSMPLAEFVRLGELLANHDGEIRVRLKFRPGKKHRILVIGECTGELEVICQTCLALMRLPVNIKIRTILVTGLDELMTLDQSEDGFVCENAEIRLTELLEDDLIMSLPMVPRHEPGLCQREGPALEQITDTWKPFAALASLSADANETYSEESKGS